MSRSAEDDFDQILREAQQRQVHPKIPQRIGEVMNRLLARKGYAQIQQAQQWDAAWVAVAGDRLSAASRVSRHNRGVLEIIVRNSSVLQELTFQKQTLLKKLRSAADVPSIRDLRFRVGEID